MEDPAALLELPQKYKTQYPPPFGHLMHQCFAMNPEYTNLNSEILGSYGTTPKPVLEACDALSDLVESSPDLFNRVTWLSLLVKVRHQLADFLHVKDVDEVVIVPNASHGLNTILRSFSWQPEDTLVTCTTTYDSISRTAQFISDTPPHPKSYKFPLLFPSTVKDILVLWREHLRQAVSQSISNGRRGKVVAVLDAIVSLPGMLLPWEDMVRICREEGVWSVVDAAHAIGQQPGINLDVVRPDFWVANCHKWLSSKRASAVLYVPKRNQHIIRSSFPTSHTYGGPNWVDHFEWNGTLDFVTFLSIAPGLAFRKWVGGEEEIYAYCHRIALEGGKKLAQILGTSLLDKSGEFTACLVNVALPLPDHFAPSPEIGLAITQKLLVERKFAASVLYHNGAWYTRCSTQIWNEVSDFERLGYALNEVCRELVEEFGMEKARL